MESEPGDATPGGLRRPAPQKGLAVPSWPTFLGAAARPPGRLGAQRRHSPAPLSPRSASRPQQRSEGPRSPAFLASPGPRPPVSTTLSHWSGQPVGTGQLSRDYGGLRKRVRDGEEQQSSGRPCQRPPDPLQAFREGVPMRCKFRPSPQVTPQGAVPPVAGPPASDPQLSCHRLRPSAPSPELREAARPQRRPPGHSPLPIPRVSCLRPTSGAPGAIPASWGARPPCSEAASVPVTMWLGLKFTSGSNAYA